MDSVAEGGDVDNWTEEELINVSHALYPQVVKKFQEGNDPVSSPKAPPVADTKPQPQPPTNPSSSPSSNPKPNPNPLKPADLPTGGPSSPEVKQPESKSEDSKTRPPGKSILHGPPVEASVVPISMRIGRSPTLQRSFPRKRRDPEARGNG